jgi:lipase chaperone LimK
MQSGKTPVVWVLFALALLTAGFLLWQSAASDAAPPEAAVQTPTQAPFVPSMIGTVPDGDLKAWSAQQALGQGSGGLPYAELRRLFEYYLTATGEASLEAITRQIHTAIDQNVPAAQVDAAKRLLARYFEFKRGLADLEKAPALAGTGVQGIRQRFAAMQDLRARIFSVEEERGMFGFEDARDMDAIARLDIFENKTLSAAQKKDQLAALDAALPAALKADREAPRTIINLEERAQAMRANGASDDEIFRMRAKELDPQAAARLAEVDRDEKAWKNRVDAYLAERTKLLKASGDATDSQRQAAVAELQNAQFSVDERRRLAAFED